MIAMPRQDKEIICPNCLGRIRLELELHVDVEPPIRVLVVKMENIRRG